MCLDCLDILKDIVWSISDIMLIRPDDQEVARMLDNDKIYELQRVRDKPYKDVGDCHINEALRLVQDMLRHLQNIEKNCILHLPLLRKKHNIWYDFLVLHVAYSTPTHFQCSTES